MTEVERKLSQAKKVNLNMTDELVDRIDHKVALVNKANPSSRPMTRSDFLRDAACEKLARDGT